MDIKCTNFKNVQTRRKWTEFFLKSIRMTINLSMYIHVVIRREWGSYNTCICTGTICSLKTLRVHILKAMCFRTPHN